jgi:hypothetical protein
MIRCPRAKSSLCYPEVFHRFCGYLDANEKFFIVRLGRRSMPVVKRQTDELCPCAKKVLDRAPKPV